MLENIKRRVAGVQLCKVVCPDVADGLHRPSDAGGPASANVPRVGAVKGRHHRESCQTNATRLTRGSSNGNANRRGRLRWGLLTARAASPRGRREIARGARGKELATGGGGCRRLR